jgi:hypothetical protein
LQEELWPKPTDARIGAKGAGTADGHCQGGPSLIHSPSFVTLISPHSLQVELGKLRLIKDSHYQCLREMIKSLLSYHERVARILEAKKPLGG